MFWTNRGKYLLFNWVFCGEPLPANFYVMLVTSDNVPTEDTNTFSELTEITEGNGYVSGGYELEPGAVDFDVITEDDVHDRALIQIKDIAWTASEGSIPDSGNGIRYAVLTDDSESSALATDERQILAVWDLETEKEITNRFTLTLANLELRLVDSDDDSITVGTPVVVPEPYAGNGWSGYQDGNDFSEDPNCVAAWLFENGALTVDSKDDNTLTIVESPTADTTNYIEGDASAAMTYDNPPYYGDAFTITDADLNANYPLKSSSEDATFSLCFWLKLTSFAESFGWRNCYWCGDIINFGVKGNEVTLLLANDEGADYYYHGTPIALDTWYHIALTFDAATNAYRIRVFDNTAEAVHGVDLTGIGIAPKLTTTDHVIGELMPNGKNTIIGNLDEMVVFNKVLTVEEIDKIRTGTFGT